MRNCIIRPLSTESETMVLVGDARLSVQTVSRLRALEADGATILSWQHKKIVQDRFPSPDVASAISELGIESHDPAESIARVSPDRGTALEVDFAVEDAVIDWFKRFGRDHFRPRYRYGPLVLWWWAELYLYHETPLRLALRDVELLARLVEARRPKKLVVVSPPRVLAAAAESLVPGIEVFGDPPPPRVSAWRTSRLHASDCTKMLGTALKSTFRRPPAPPAGSPRVFFLTHGSMWRGDREMYFDRVIPAVEREAETSVVAFGPPRPFRQRSASANLRDFLELDEDRLPYRPIRRYFTLGMGLELLGAFSRCRRMWRSFRDEQLASLEHRGVPLGREAALSMRDTFYRQLPWAIRAYHEVSRVLEVDEPDVLVLYAESSGLGRAAVTAAREREVPSFAIQHGIMYPQYYSHEHSPDELEGEAEGLAVPTPTRTAVYGSAARDLLVERGSYDPERILITGSPKFDELVRASEGYDREAVRERLGVPEGDRFVVLATRWIAVGAVFEELVEAVEQREGLWLFVKPHQAEPLEPYDEVLARTSPRRCRRLPASESLLELLFASDGLVTVDSFASSEALVLGRPVLVVNLPSNLGPLVDKRVALGVRGGEPIGPALDTLLYDEAASRALEETRRDYLQEFAFGADGGSTERIVEAILREGREKLEGQAP